MTSSFRCFSFVRCAVLPECRFYIPKVIALTITPLLFQRRCLAHIIAKSYPIRTVIQFSKYNWGGICQDRKFDLSAKRKIKSRHISTLIIGESFALASNQMLICDGFELFKRPYCLRRLNSTLNSTKTAVASHGTLRKENTAGIADWCLTIPLRRHHIQLYTS